MNIRPETPADYHAVAAVHTSAFATVDEAYLVPLLRAMATYDPALSLVAEIDGRVIGHAFFMPYTIRLLDSDMRAVNLAPLGVDAAYQNRGVGSALMSEGHRIARERGHDIAFLLGHPTYYPRFGYRTHAFGTAKIDPPTAGLPDPTHSPLTARAPAAGDVPALLAMWLHEEGAVDFAIRPGEALIDWLSPDPRVIASVYVQDETVVGYVRVRVTQPHRPLVFLAADRQSALWMAADLSAGVQSLTLPLHPQSDSARAFAVPAHAQAWEAGMATALMSGALDEYFEGISAGRRTAGRPIWPPSFELLP